jgi:hypothetical protein
MIAPALFIFEPEAFGVGGALSTSHWLQKRANLFRLRERSAGELIRQFVNLGADISTKKLEGCDCC